MTLAKIPAEFEAKLLAPGENTLRAIARLREIGSYRLTRVGMSRLHSLYLDTKELSLARHGIALRLRRSGRRWEATIKWEGRTNGELHDRPELTVPVRGRPSFPFEVKQPQLREYLAARVAGRPLNVVLVTDIRRTRMNILRAEAPDDAEPLAEICLDRVHLHGEAENGPESRYCEVEVEQLKGSRSDVRQVAALLKHAFNLFPSTDTKFGRGLLLFHRSAWLAAPRGGLVAEDTVDSAARKFVWRQLSKLRRFDPGTRHGDDPEALHDMRVATRRLRAALGTFRAAFTPRLWTYLSDELKWLRRNLGDVRDMDVQLQRVAEFGASTPAGLRTSLEAYSSYLERRRAGHRKTMLTALDSRRYYMLLRRLERFAVGAGSARQERALGAVGAVAADQVEKAYRDVRKRGRKVQAEPTPEDLHVLRIRAKRLRYALELCSDLTGKEGSRAVRRLVKLQDLLGMFHDAIVAAEFVRQYVEGPGKRTGSAALITLGALMAQELRRAEDMRHDFHRTWERFERRRTRRDFEAIIRRLRKDGPTAAPEPAPEAAVVVAEADSQSSEVPADKDVAEVPAREPALKLAEPRRPPAKRGDGNDGPRVAAAGDRDW